MNHTLKFALLLLWGTTAIAGGDAPDCSQRVLEELGWRFVSTEAAVPSIEPGTPCDRADLREAQAAGDLVVGVPRGIDAFARALVPGRDLPVGVITAALGAPALIVLIARRR